MDLDEDGFAELFVEVVREFGRAIVRREVVQRAVECVVERAGRFNGDDVPSYMQAYNEEMDARDVEEALRLEFFYRIAVLGNMSLRMEPDRTGCKLQRTGSSQNRPRSVPTDWEDRDVNMPKSHMGINMT